jgi:predicted aconitase
MYTAAVNHERELNNLSITPLKTCTPYLSGNTPAKGEHCAWMESSAVIFCNSVIGAKTNVEGRESTSAAMIAGRIPYWGLHLDENRIGDHLIRIEVAFDENILDWGLFGYFVGEIAGEQIPVISGVTASPTLMEHKHFGAAAASSGSVEMYHIVGCTPEAPSEKVAFAKRTPKVVVSYSKSDRRRIYETLNSGGKSLNVDFVMLGCPHYSVEQLKLVANLLQGKQISGNTRLWIFTSRHEYQLAMFNGYIKTIKSSGAEVLTDTCSAFAQSVPEGTRVVALDSVKQAHYLPAIMGVSVWLGSLSDCVTAALTGVWRGELV